RLVAVVVGASGRDRRNPLQRRGNGYWLLRAAEEIRSVPTHCVGRSRHHRHRATVVWLAGLRLSVLFSRNLSSSTGNGRTRVEFFSAATSTTVSRRRNSSEVGLLAITPAA